MRSNETRLRKLKLQVPLRLGASSYALASHHWGPDFASRSLRVSFVVDEMESGYVFVGVSPVFPRYEFHSTISPHSFISFHSISFRPLL